MITVDLCWPLAGCTTNGGLVGHTLVSAVDGAAAMGRCAAAAWAAGRSLD